VRLFDQAASTPAPTDHASVRHAPLQCIGTARGSNSERIVGRVKRLASVVFEFNETDVLYAVGLCVRNREYDPFAQLFFWSEDDLDFVAVGPRGPFFILGIDARRAVGPTPTLPSAAIEPDRKVNDEM
jgi:hypothetical protein